MGRAFITSRPRRVSAARADSPTRRTIVKTGVKLAYVAPIVAASFKVSAVNAQAPISPPPQEGCFHSTGTNGGCMPACTNGGRFTGAQCGVICGTGNPNNPDDGACPVGQGGDNPCCNPGYCDPDNYEADPETGDPVYTGDPPGGCIGTASAKKQGKAKRR